MTEIAGTTYSKSGDRLYLIGGQAIPSVSTVGGALYKPAIEGWKWKAIAAAVATDPRLQSMVARGSTYRAAAEAVEAIPTDKADMGTAVHCATEVYDATGSVGEAMYAVERLVATWSRTRAAYAPLDIVRQHLARWIDARRDHGIVPVIIEQTIYNPAVGYAGTMDRAVGIANPDAAAHVHEGCDLAHVLDVKTGAKVWPETAMQLAAYARATHRWHWRYREPVEITEPLCHEVGIVASLHADAPCQLVPARLGKAWRAFRAAVAAWQWAEQDSDGALIEPVPALDATRPW